MKKHLKILCKSVTSPLLMQETSHFNDRSCHWQNSDLHGLKIITDFPYNKTLDITESGIILWWSEGEGPQRCWTCDIRCPQGNTGICYKILFGCSMAVLPCPFHEESDEIFSYKYTKLCRYLLLRHISRGYFLMNLLNIISNQFPIKNCLWMILTDIDFSNERW